MRKIAFAAALLGLLVPIAAAQATVVQEFTFQLKDVKPDGRFTVVFTSRTFDNTGAIPPVLRENFLRLPAGAKLNRVFLNRKYYCNGSQLLKDLQANPEPGTLFFRRVDNLTPFIKKLKKSRLAADRKASRNAEVCQRSLTGKGTVQVDARPFINELIPAKIFLFFGKGTQPGAVASFQIIGVPDETAPVVKNTPVVRDTRVALASNFFSQPTEGKYDYKLVLPAGPVAGVNISVAEVNVTNKGLTAVKKKTTCLKRKRGKCTKKKVKKTTQFWFTRPTCPSSGKLNFLAFYGYDDPTPDITKTIELPCPKFSS
jgi:hypothetical protein